MKNKTYTDLSKEEILIKIIETESLLHNIQDVDILLEHILTEARSVSMPMQAPFMWQKTTVF